MFKLKMKLISVCILILFTGNLLAQTTKVDITLKDVPLKEFFAAIEKKTTYSFMLGSNIDQTQRITVTAKQEELSDLLRKVLSEKDILFEITGKQIILRPRNTSKAQQSNSPQRIKGAVTDNRGESIIGANVIIKGSSTGTITDIDGQFEMEVSPGSILQISYIGFTPQEISVGNKQNISISLIEDSQTLDEVVVVGYGVQKKKLVTGATVQVKGDDIRRLNTVSPMGALQSQTPGVNITKSSGQPGEGFKVSIRGMGTTGNASPLYIVDGVTSDNIDNLNPSDIESIDVLKDAASAAIYGARAANGVVLVTTKQGKKGKASIQYDGYTGIQNIYKKVNPLNASQYALIMNEAATNSNLPAYNFETLVPNWDKIQNGQWQGTNWLNEMSNKNAPTQNHALNIVGGTDQSVYSLGVSYTSQEGILGKPSSPNYTRYTARVNTEHTLIGGSEHSVLKMGENINFSFTEKSGIAIGGRDNNDVGNALKTNPFLPVYNESGNYNYAIPWNEEEANPIGILDYERGGNQNKEYNLKGNIYLVINPTKALSFRSSFGINAYSGSYRSYIPEYELSTRSYRTEDLVKQSMMVGSRWIFENTLNYNKSFLNLHKINAIIGFSAEKSGMGESMNGSNVNAIFDDYEHGYLDNTKIVSSDKTILGGAPWKRERLLSFFGRLNYDYKETYMATLVFRSDASSNFASGKQWGTFPSLSAGWVLSNESFMEKTTNWLPFLKLRVSWGQNGNADIQPFQYLSTIAFDAMYFPGTDKLAGTTGAYSNILPNPDVTWETSEQTDLGFDARLADGKISLSFDWYNKSTKDWLVRAPILGTYGTGAPYINGGNVTNKGYEVALGWNHTNKQGLTYGINLNAAHNKNKITRIANSEGIIHGPTGALSTNTAELYRAQVGYPIGYFWGYKTNGIFQNADEVTAYTNPEGKLIQPGAVPGDVRFVNTDNNNIIDEKDKVMIGDPNPDYTFGLSFNLAFKGLDFTIVTSGVTGNQIATSYRSFADRPLQNYTTDVLNRWHGEGTSNKIPRVTITSHINRQYISDLYIENGDYWRISNVTLGYDFKKLCKQIPVQQMRLYFSAQNLFTYTGYSGMDPEVGYGYGNSWASGIDLGFYPTPRTFLLGVTIKY